jgi:hypothetical protein
LVAHGDYSSIANYQIKTLAIFRGIFGIFHGISKFLIIYSTIFRGTPDNVLRNPGWETLVEEVKNIKMEVDCDKVFTQKLVETCGSVTSERLKKE